MFHTTRTPNRNFALRLDAITSQGRSTVKRSIGARFRREEIGLAMQIRRHPARVSLTTGSSDSCTPIFVQLGGLANRVAKDAPTATRSCI